MPSPGTCSRCRRALAADSSGVLCPACQMAAAEASPIAATRTAGFMGVDADATSSRTAGDTDDFLPNSRAYSPLSPPGYELLDRLGIGGMGTVYRARELAAERTVAIKFLNSPSNPSSFERFLVEARALARLDHPNIIKVFTVETNWREPFLTMEYADGGTLADIACPGQLPSPTEAAELMLAVTDAIACAHAADILHRDIKPNNILLTRTKGQGSGVSDQEFRLDSEPASLTPKVSDFGLAKRTDRDDGLTRTGGPLGTPRYMSPEAAAGRYADVGPRADVYGLGATFYHLLTGRPPFSGDDHDQIIRKVLTEQPVRPRALRPDLPAELEGLVVKAMEKNPPARYPTAAALAADLRRFLAGESPEAPVLSPRRRMGRWFARNRPRIAVATAVIAMVALIALAIWNRQRNSDPERVIRREIANDQTARLLAADGRPRSPQWPLGQAKWSATDADGGTLTFEATEARMLILLADPGIDAYRVDAEICQKRKLDPGNPSTCEVGLVLAYSSQDGPNENRVHGMLLLALTEPEPADPPGAKRELALMDVGFVTGPPWIASPSFHLQRGVPPAPLKHSPAGEPEWRPVFAEVRPDGILVPGRAKPQLVDPVGIARRRGDLHRNIAAGQTDPVAPFPEWTPRMPIGVWARNSWISVRNVTVRALK